MLQLITPVDLVFGDLGKSSFSGVQEGEASEGESQEGSKSKGAGQLKHTPNTVRTLSCGWSKPRLSLQHSSNCNGPVKKLGPKAHHLTQGNCFN